MIKLNSKVLGTKALLIAAFFTACNNLGSDYKMENRTPATWVSGLGLKTDNFFSNNISSELDWNKYSQNHGIHIFPDHLLFNSDGAIKIPGFANANYNCKLNSAFFALLAELYIELSNNNSDFLVKFKNFYEEKISWAKKFKYENYMKLWRKGDIKEERSAALLCALDRISTYSFDEKKKAKLLDQVKFLTEEMVEDMTALRKIEEEYYDLPDDKHKEEECEEAGRNFFAKYPFNIVDSTIYKYENIKRTRKSSPKYSEYCLNCQKQLYGNLNFIYPLTYKAMSIVENLEKETDYFLYLEKTFWAEEVNCGNGDRDLLTSLYVYEFLVKPFIEKEDFGVLNFKKEKENKSEEEKYSDIYNILENNIEKLKVLFYILFIDHTAYGPHKGTHFVSKLLSKDKLSLAQISEIGKLFSKIIGYEFYGSEDHIFGKENLIANNS